MNDRGRDIVRGLEGRERERGRLGKREGGIRREREREEGQEIGLKRDMEPVS